MYEPTAPILFLTTSASLDSAWWENVKISLELFYISLSFQK